MTSGRSHALWAVRAQSRVVDGKAEVWPLAEANGLADNAARSRARAYAQPTDWARAPASPKSSAVGACGIVALSGLACAPLIPVFGGAALVRPVVGGLVVGGIVAGVAAWRRLQPLLTAALATATYLLVGPALAVPEYAHWGLVPSLRAEQWLVTGLTTVWRRLLTVPVPVGTGGGFGLAPFLLVYIGAVVGVSAALRLKSRQAPAAALVPLGLVIASVVLGTDRAVAAIPLGLVSGLGALVWAAWRARTLRLARWVALMTASAIALGAGAVAGEAAARRERAVVREHVTAPFDPRDYPSPLAAYRRYIKQGVQGKVMAEVADLPAGGVVKLAVMDRFDGIVWNVAGGGSEAGSGNFGRMPAAAVPPGGVEVTVRDRDTSTVWLYSVGSPQAVRFAGADAADLRESLRFNAATGTMALPAAAVDAVTYTISTLTGVYRPAAERIAAAEATRLPQPASTKVQAADLKAASITQRATTGGAKALALEQFLQDGYYSDGQEGPGQGAGRTQSLAGHGADRIGELLTAELMVGNAEQYASAMALMARSLGLPARVVMGFAPGYGEQVAANSSHQGPQGTGAEAGSYTFQGLDMTAWVEINLEGLGWVPFFPTPNRQDSPEEAEERADPKPEPQVIQPPPPEAKPSEPPDEELAPVPVGSAKPVVAPEAGFTWGPLTITAAGCGLLLFAGVAFAALTVFAKARRRDRRRGPGPPAHRIVAGWEEIVDALRDLGWAAPSGGVAVTRSQVAGCAPSQARGAVRRLAAQSDAAAFGALALTVDHADRYWQGVIQVEALLRGELSPWGRLRYRLARGSLRARRAARRGARRAHLPSESRLAR
ncbi:MAG: hypothetical protein LBE08_00575 [Bifidobacteriaceae bacterium]|jgi:transglutaminase-like putative cysteine protease|nr:hypothetical protein [Bifidobacteriaceae bacterium]